MEMNMTNLLWFFAVILLVGGNGGLGGLFGGGRAPMGPPPATQTDVNNAINNQSVQNGLSALGISTANNNYETARLITEQNNTNLVNMIQGFNAMQQQNNALVQNLSQQNNMLAQSIQALGYQMSSCCCEIKTQNLENRLADKTAEAVALKGELDNRNQTATILNSLGRFVAWAGSGAPTTSAASVG